MQTVSVLSSLSARQQMLFIQSDWPYTNWEQSWVKRPQSQYSELNISLVCYMTLFQPYTANRFHDPRVLSSPKPNTVPLNEAPWLL